MLIERYYTLPLSLCLLIFVLVGRVSYALECQSETYNDISFLESTDTFSPYDKIFLKIFCDEIPTGKQTFYVKWTKDDLGVIRTDKQEVEVVSPDGFMVYFWIKLHKSGVLSSGLTNKDFDDTYYGDWTVDVFVDDLSISVNKFSVKEGSE